MITRQQMVDALRVLHTDDQITKIVTRAKRIDVFFRSENRDGLLVLPLTPTQNDHTNTTKSNVNTTKN